MKETEYTSDMIKMIAGNEKEWREHLLFLISDTRKEVKRQNGRIRKLEIVVAVILFAFFGYGGWRIFF